MTISINYKNGSSKKNSTNLVLFLDEKLNISNIRKFISSSEYTFISDMIKIKSPKNQIVSFDISSKRKIILVSLKKNISSSDLENLGASFYDQFKDLKQNEYYVNSDSLISQNKNYLGNFLHGIRLKSYSFEKYKTKKNKKNIFSFADNNRFLCLQVLAGTNTRGLTQL